MGTIDIKLTTEKTGINEKDSTNIYPYDFNKDNVRLDIYDKKKIIITNYQVNQPDTRVEIFFTDSRGETINVFYDCTIDIPDFCRSLIFVLDEFDYSDEILRKRIVRSSNEKEVSFSFELV